MRTTLRQASNLALLLRPIWCPLILMVTTLSSLGSILFWQYTGDTKGGIISSSGALETRAAHHEEHKKSPRSIAANFFYYFPSDRHGSSSHDDGGTSSRFDPITMMQMEEEAVTTATSTDILDDDILDDILYDILDDKEAEHEEEDEEDVLQDESDNAGGRGGAGEQTSVEMHMQHQATQQPNQISSSVSSSSSSELDLFNLSNSEQQKQHPEWMKNSLVKLPDLLPNVDKGTQKAYMISILANYTGRKPSKLEKWMRRIDVPSWFLPKTALPCPHDIVPNGTTNITIYSPTYGDRSGAVIEHMISAYSYAFEHGFNYGGSISRTNNNRWNRKHKLHDELIQSIGLDGILKFTTPPNPEEEEFDKSFFVWTEICATHTKYPLSFIQHIQSLVQQRRMKKSDNGNANEHDNDNDNNNGNDNDNEYEYDNDNDNDNERKSQQQQKVVVHVRRGDAHPCTILRTFRVRYSPNAYYLQTIQQYADHNANVTIFSESDSFESFDEFMDLGYNMRLDGSLFEAWYEMRTADILIMSPGSLFSIVPALLNPNRVYYKEQINNWIGVSESIMDDSNRILNELVNERCDTWLQDNPQHRDEKE